jgi:hypothetical protein
MPPFEDLIRTTLSDLAEEATPVDLSKHAIARAARRRTVTLSVTAAGVVAAVVIGTPLAFAAANHSSPGDGGPHPVPSPSSSEVVPGPVPSPATSTWAGGGEPSLSSPIPSPTVNRPGPSQSATDLTGPPPSALASPGASLPAPVASPSTRG